MRTLSKRTFTSVALCVALTAPSVSAQLKNGDFENGLSDWKEVGGVTANGPGAGGTANGAEIGPSPGLPVGGGGSHASGIVQKFDCGAADNSCFIKFHYKFPANLTGSVARIVIRGTAGRKTAALPFSAAYTPLQVEYPDCGEIELFFGIVEPGASVTSEFRVDEVEAKCDTVGYAVPGIGLVNVADQCADDECRWFEELVALLLELLAEVVPTLSEWGLAALALILLAAGSLTVARRRVPEAPSPRS